MRERHPQPPVHVVERAALINSSWWNFMLALSSSILEGRYVRTYTDEPVVYDCVMVTW
jgi:hypothetical protein